MIGAIIGDIVGSIYEFENKKSKDINFFEGNVHFTDDTVMTIAVANAILNCDGNYEFLEKEVVKSMQYFGIKHFDAGYGNNFKIWLKTENPPKNTSFGNGAAMRISSVAYACKDLNELKKLCKVITSVSHDHEQSYVAAEAVAVAIYMAINKNSMEEIKSHIQNNYYDLNFTLDEIRENYKFEVSCAKSVPQAFVAFFESNSFEDCIKNAISIGGDSDTIAAISASIASAFYGVSKDLKEKSISYLSPDLLSVLTKFSEKYDIK